MPSSKPSSSVLHHFAAVPHRAFGDKRFKARHYRVLGGICIAVDPNTGHALISQRRISRWANISRQYVTGAARDLESWGYIKRIIRGRGQHGKFKTLIYAILYDAQPPAQSTSGGDMAHVTHVSDTTVSPPEAAESDTLSPNIQDESDRGGKDANFVSPGYIKRAPSPSDDNQPIGRQTASHAPSPPVQGAHGQAARGDAGNLVRRVAALSKADALEKGHRHAAETQIRKGLFKAFPGDAAPDALQAMTEDLYESAVDAEMRRPGNGVSMVVRAVKRTISRKS